MQVGTGWEHSVCGAACARPIWGWEGTEGWCDVGAGAKGQRCQRESRTGGRDITGLYGCPPSSSWASLANIVSTKLLSQYNPSVFILWRHGWQYPLGPSAVGICKLSFHGSAVCAVKTSYFVPKHRSNMVPVDSVQASGQKLVQTEG